MTTIKLLIFSDSHGAEGVMLDIVQREQPQEIIHLGDCLRDTQVLTCIYPDIPLIAVPGNCDGWTGMQDRLMLERQGVRILLAHGHQWHVKSGSIHAVDAARASGADILLYGHTHRAVCRQEDDLWIMNPGTVGGVWAPATYGVVEIEKGNAALRVIPVE